MAGSKANFMERGLPKAVFDMNCDKEKLEVVDLGYGAMGVRGCGKQGRYVYARGAGWVLNASDENTSK
jgi:hypothetical protein